MAVYTAGQPRQQGIEVGGDLFLFPSRSETFGNVTLEAMASGVATVAFDSGAAREHLADGVHGALAGTEAQFLAAAVRLGGDGSTRHALGHAARAATGLLRPDLVAADFDALLAGLARRGDRHAALAA
jgi:glycosyltransferase involved in cell wall biosynthesis